MSQFSWDSRKIYLETLNGRFVQKWVVRIHLKKKKIYKWFRMIPWKTTIGNILNDTGHQVTSSNNTAPEKLCERSA